MGVCSEASPHQEIVSWGWKENFSHLSFPNWSEEGFPSSASSCSQMPGNFCHFEILGITKVLEHAGQMLSTEVHLY